MKGKRLTGKRGTKNAEQEVRKAEILEWKMPIPPKITVPTGESSQMEVDEGRDSEIEVPKVEEPVNNLEPTPYRHKNGDWVYPCKCGKNFLSRDYLLLHRKNNGH